MSDKPTYLPGQTMTVTSYAGKPRRDRANVYEVRYDYNKKDWLYSVELLPHEPETTSSNTPPVTVTNKVEFRKFWESKMEAE